MDEPGTYLAFGDFVIDVRQRQLMRRNGQVIPLTAKVFDTLLFLARHPGEPLDRDTLLRGIWDELVVEENSLTQNISTLRQVLGEARGENRYIVTLPRRGYHFVAVVTPLDSFSPARHDAQPKSSAPARRRRVAVAAIAAIALLVGFTLVQLKSRDAAPPPTQRLAVLPFKSLVSSQGDESLQLGMTESLIAALGEQTTMHVLPLSSVRRFAAPDQDALDAGRALDADSVLDGSLQLRDGRLRVSARLLRVRDGAQLWFANFDEDVTTIFDVQDAIATRVVDALATRLPAAPRSPRRETTDAEAYLLFANGRLAWTRFDEPGLTRAIDYFERAIARDPRYARAYAGLADCYAILGVFGIRAPRDTYPRGREAAETALRLDPELAAAHATLGHIQIQYDLDWAGGLAHYARALELDPDYAPTYHFRGIVLGMHGETERAVADLRTAQRLEPLWVAPRAANGMVLYFARRYEESIKLLTETLALDDRADNARSYLGRAYLHSGQFEKALSEFRRRRNPAPGSFSDIPQTLAMSGHPDEARAELGRLLELSHRQYVPALDIASVYASLGDVQNALTWLDRAYEERSTNLGFLGQDPTFDSLRAQPRFVELVRKIGVWKRPV
jgi:DNA-binding winged helix-turn-helix (wHTH) protein/TolB-like protein/Flp pilus assembly protein TadD